jgi:hypothetical protein
MKKMLGVCISIGLMCFVSKPAFSARVDEKVSYKGWVCLKMSNQNTEVYIAPEIGGRIIQYKYQGHEFLWTNPDLHGKVYPPEQNSSLETWKNYGGDKIWPAPQGWDTKDQWPGPGDVVIEAPYSYEILAAKGREVKVRISGSDKGGWAGVQFIREFTLRDESSRLDLLTTMKNVTTKPVRWGIWSVTQMDLRAQNEKTYNDQVTLYIPMNPRSIYPAGYNVMFGLAKSFNWKPDYNKIMMKVKYENIVGKIGIDTAAGWAAMVDEKNDLTFVQRFPCFQDMPYPDNASFEVWVAGKGYYIHKHKLLYAENDPKSRLIEMEILSPLVKLKPGESYSFPSSWEAHQGPLKKVPDLKKGYFQIR